MPRATRQSLVDTEFVRKQVREIRRLTGQSIDEVAQEYHDRARMHRLPEGARYKHRFAKMIRHKWNYAPLTIEKMLPVMDEWNAELGIVWENRKLVSTPANGNLLEEKQAEAALEEIAVTERTMADMYEPFTVTESERQQDLELLQQDLTYLRQRVEELLLENQQLRRELNTLNGQPTPQPAPTTGLFREALEITISTMTPEERKQLLRELLGAS